MNVCHKSCDFLFKIVESVDHGIVGFVIGFVFGLIFIIRASIQILRVSKLAFLVRGR
jgi:uncharacterized membrane protein